MDPDCKSKMDGGYTGRVNVEYNSYVALALGIGDPSLFKTSPCRARWRVKRIAIEN